ncbi:MAG: TlpA family protein disulfide reductase [Alphaproteobacteria bacterium]|nr:TlpA family protein disulfide reductase [Alphaproteobacteria bacterium]
MFRPTRRKTLALLAAAYPAAALAAAGDNIGKFSAHKEPKPVPPLAFRDSGDRPLGLEAFRGKVVVLNIWATWCVPCREEMPSLDRLQARLGGPDLEVVAVSVDRGGAAKAKAFLEEIGAKHLKLYLDPTMKITRELKAPGLPVTVVIDREGREVGRLIGGAEWDTPRAIALLQDFVARPRAA